MFKSWKLGQVAGIDLYIHPTFWLLLAFVFATQGSVLSVAITAAIFGCIVLHELGHALTARAYGIGTRDITLYPIGGVASLARMPRSPGAELLITLAGPATNLAIAGVLAAVLWIANLLEAGASGTVLGHFVSYLVTANLVLAAFNLLPAFPMDGGRIVRALLSGWLGRLRATEVAVSIGQTLALVLPVALLYLNMFSPMTLVLAVFVYLAAGAELASVRHEASASHRPTPAHSPPAGFRWVHCGGGIWQLAPISVNSAHESTARGRTRDTHRWH